MVFKGADPADAPAEDALEELWRTYYASIFNPARLNPKQMQKEMPKRYWRNLPEAALIPELIARAERATDHGRRPPQQAARALKAALRHARDASYDGSLPTSLDDIARRGRALPPLRPLARRHPGRAGRGPAKARLMFVGEQPGDQEDLAGRPFVGPAGQVFDKALAEAGVARDRTYVTNAVKHFKHELRGKRRIHKTPDRGEVTACRWWLDAERRLVKPRVIVMLGATAALGVIGKPTPIGANRGKALQLADHAQGVVTYHPSFLLRLPDEDAKARAYAEFVEDLRMAGELAGLI
jgi:uracil-DNA glycosylase family protein